MSRALGAERWVALFLLVLSVSYGYFALELESLTLGRSEVLGPRTFPLVLAACGTLLSLVLLLRPRAPGATVPDGRWRGDWFSLVLVMGLMALYAVTLRPLGFFVATWFFLAASSWALGERRVKVLAGVCLAVVLVFELTIRTLLGLYVQDPVWELLGRVLSGR